MKIDPIQACDFYKVGHKFQYPAGTEYVYSNFTPRSDRLAPKTTLKSDGHIVWFGLQSFIQWFLIDCFNQEFFSQPKEKVINEYNRRMNSALGPNSVDPSHIAALHDLGYLPIEIRALPEGTLVPVKVPVLTIVNTLPEFYWLTNYIESVMSAELWHMTTSATIAYKYRELLEHYAKITGSPKDFVLWQGHDFSMRGMEGVHAAAKSGAGHLTSFLGTDTIPAMKFVEDYYGGLNTFVGGSVPATEHSVMCMGGKETEKETFRRLIKDIYPSGVVSIVSDTWDFWKVISETAAELKEDILNRTPNELGLAKVVFRPDSGDPVEVLCGSRVIDYSKYFDEDYDEDDVIDYLRDTILDYDGDWDGIFRIGDKIFKAEFDYWESSGGCEWNSPASVDSITYKEYTLTPKDKGAVETLWDIFGGTVTDTGYKVLNQRVGLIYGDSITLEKAVSILKRLKDKGFASCNVVFGIGSFTYQYVTRDTFGFAIKSTWGMINGEEQMIFKDPVTDNGVKKSAKGLLIVNTDQNGKLNLKDNLSYSTYNVRLDEDQMRLVFQDGELMRKTNLEQIRETINSNFA